MTEEEGSSNILLSNTEPVIPASESSVEKASTSFESSQQSGSSVPPTSTVQEAVVDSTAEVSASNVSLQMPSQSADDLPPESVPDAVVQNSADELPQQQSMPDAVAHNSASNISLTADSVQTPERKMPQSEPVIPTVSGDRRPSGPLLLDLKRQRAREREERMRRHSNQSPDANSFGLVASKTNGTVTNGVTGASQHPVSDNATFVGTRHRYSNRYDITAPDDKEKCCIVM